MTTTIAKLSKRVHDVTRALGGMRAALDTQIEEMQHVQRRLMELAKAEAASAERERREEQGRDVCEGCEKEKPIEEMVGVDEYGNRYCRACCSEATNAPA